MSELAILTQERDEAEAEQSVLFSTAARFQRERDEARALARRLLKLGTWERLTARSFEEFPWLPE